MTQRLSQIRRHLDNTSESETSSIPFPSLPIGADYLFLKNATKRNALSYEVLQDLRNQLLSFNRSPVDGRVRMLPPFDPKIVAELEEALQRNDSQAFETYGWLIDPDEWMEHRSSLPRVLVLRGAGPVFCSGHDLNEVQGMTHTDCKDLFNLCAEVMSLIRRSPTPIIGMVHGLATAAGAQLALTTDLPVAHGSTEFRLPGSAMGFPCISPSTAVSRNVGDAFGYRMFALSDPHRADKLPGRPVMVVEDHKLLEAAVDELVAYYTEKDNGAGSSFRQMGFLHPDRFWQDKASRWI